MKAHLQAAALGVGSVFLLVTLVRGYHARTYDEEFELLEQEIARHPTLRIVNFWRHEDVILEDFGFTIRGPTARLRLDIGDGTHIRRPADRVVGIAYLVVQPPRSPDTLAPWSLHRIRFDSDDWKARGLPAVRTLADVVAHFDVIAASLRTRPPPRIERVSDPGFLLLTREVKRGVEDS